MKILIDNGHGSNTAGKRSPVGGKYGILYEWKFTRRVAKPLVDRLKALGFDAELVVTEELDVSLAERVRRVNSWCDKLGAKNCVFISIHGNAAGSASKWLNASGWSGYVYTGASDNSKKLAQLLYDEAEKRGLKGNRSVPADRYWTAGFYVIKNTKCPAVLTENLFYDNLENYEFMSTQAGVDTFVDLHVSALLKYIELQKK